MGAASATGVDRIEWALQSSNPVAYAPHLHEQPLAGVAPGPILFMLARGYKTVPNPSTAAMLRAGDPSDPTIRPGAR